MSLFSRFDLTGKNFSHYVLGRGESLFERVKDGVSTEAQKRLEEHRTHQVSAGEISRARTIEQQFSPGDNNVEMRLRGGSIKA